MCLQCQMITSFKVLKYFTIRQNKILCVCQPMVERFQTGKIDIFSWNPDPHNNRLDRNRVDIPN